jgi:membrane protease YdiL (CAAX protease family)
MLKITNVKNLPPLIIDAFCYCMMFILTWISKRNKSNRLFDAKGNRAVNTGNLLGLHIAGIGGLGLVPITLFNQSFESILFGKGLPPNFFVIVWLFLLFAIGFTGLRAGSQIQICRHNSNGFSSAFLIHYFLVRILFLCSYELFFRGFLLVECIQRVGIFWAVLVTTGLTVLIHVFTNKKEMWACIPFGIILSICCITFNAVWPAILLHVALSLAYEIPPAHQFLNQLKFVK